MLVAEKLMSIQQELKAPKGQYNSFGKYKYRSCEDILEAVKPLLGKNKAALTISDNLIFVGSRYYIQATAVLTDAESGESISNTAYARESEEKKGMDDSQITGTASSYARKYALNGLFCIDDNKDADTDEYANRQQGQAASGNRPQSGRTQARGQAQQPRAQQSRPQQSRQSQQSQTPQQAPQTQGPITVNDNHIQALLSEMARTGVTEETVLAMAKTDSLQKLTMEMFMKLMNKFQKTPDRKPAPEDDFMEVPEVADEELPFN